MIDLLTLQFLKGPTFLVVYGTLSVLCYLLASRVTGELRRISTGRTSPTPLGTYHLALLQGDKQRALLSALVRLEAAGAIKVDSAAQPPTVVRIEDLRVEDGLEAVILSCLSRPLSLAELTRVSAVDARLSLLEEELYAQDLLIPRQAIRANSDKVVSLFAPLFLLGGGRLMVGMSLGRPVGFLVLMLFANLLLTGLSQSAGRRNERGERLLQDRVKGYAALEMTADSSGRVGLSSQDLSLAMALFGASTLATALMPVSGSGGSCGSSSSCGSSCGGGCGGGCGG